jgi:hypothetical protein
VVFLKCFQKIPHCRNISKNTTLSYHFKTFNRKLIERGKIDTPKTNTHTHARTHIFGEVLTAKIYVICWNITTYKNMDVKLLHPVWKDFLDTVNTVVLTGYWKQLIIFLFDIQCFFQSGLECGPWTKLVQLLTHCLVIHRLSNVKLSSGYDTTG